MNKRLLAFLAGLLCVAVLAADEGAWGTLKKIHFYRSVGAHADAMQLLQRLDLQRLGRLEKSQVCRELHHLGDLYFQAGDFTNAEVVYRRVLQFAPDSWAMYNKLQVVAAAKGGFGFQPGLVLRQVGLVFRDFHSAILLLGNFLQVFFYVLLLTLFAHALLCFVRYFRLALNDFTAEGGGMSPRLRLILLGGLLIWPMFLLAGWAAYPFLIIGFLWVYLSDGEKRHTIVLTALVALGALGYSFSLSLERNLQLPGFRDAHAVFNGEIFPEAKYRLFDNEMKVVQAYAMYEKGRIDPALDLLNATGPNYVDPWKYDLLGVIYLQKGNYEQSARVLQDSLSIDEKNPVALANFAQVLRKNPNPEVFDSLSERFPGLRNYRDEHGPLRVPQLDDGFLWRRALGGGADSSPLWPLVQGILLHFLRLPVLYYLGLMILYIYLFHSRFPHFGRSTYCTKCSKIIKRIGGESHLLCDECYQLFLIKDAVFLEAKIIKEKELDRGTQRRFLVALGVSLLLPGYHFTFEGRNHWFSLFFTLFAFFFGFYLVGGILFARAFGTVPILFNGAGVLAFIVYFIGNLPALRGDIDGL